jgi:hypothetical protein
VLIIPPGRHWRCSLACWSASLASSVSLRPWESVSKNQCGLHQQHLRNNCQFFPLACTAMHVYIWSCTSELNTTQHSIHTHTHTHTHTRFLGNSANSEVWEAVLFEKGTGYRIHVTLSFLVVTLQSESKWMRIILTLGIYFNHMYIIDSMIDMEYCILMSLGIWGIWHLYISVQSRHISLTLTLTLYEWASSRAGFSQGSEPTAGLVETHAVTSSSSSLSVDLALCTTDSTSEKVQEVPIQLALDNTGSHCFRTMFYLS